MAFWKRMHWTFLKHDTKVRVSFQSQKPTFLSVFENGEGPTQNTARSGVPRSMIVGYYLWFSPVFRNQLSVPPVQKLVFVMFRNMRTDLKMTSSHNWCIKPVYSFVYLNERFLQLFLQWSSRNRLVFRTVVLKLFHASKSLRELLKIWIPGPTPKISDFLQLGGTQVCISKGFPGDADAVGPRTTLGKHWSWGRNCYN